MTTILILAYLVCAVAGCVGFIAYGEYENATVEQVQSIRNLIWLLWFFLMGISHFIIQGMLR